MGNINQCRINGTWEINCNGLTNGVQLIREDGTGVAWKEGLDVIWLDSPWGVYSGIGPPPSWHGCIFW